MTTAEAARLLDLPPDATPEQLETRFLELRAKLEEKIAKAPTPGLKEKYRASLADITAAFEQLTLAADSSDLPVLQRSGPAKTTASAAPSPSPAPRADSPASPKPKAKNSGNREFVVVALIAIALLGGGGWWVMKIRADNEEKLRIETTVKAAAEKEKNRQESLFAQIRASQAEQKIRWESLEKELASAERKLSELKADTRNIKELSATDVAELVAYTEMLNKDKKLYDELQTQVSLIKVYSEQKRNLTDLEIIATNPEVGQLIKSYTSSTINLAVHKIKYGPKHPKMLEALNALETTSGELDLAIKNAVDKTEADVSRLKHNYDNSLKRVDDKKLHMGNVNQLQARFTAQGDYVDWLQPYLSRHPAKTQLAKLDAFLTAKAWDDASFLSTELTQGLTKAEQEVAAQKKSLLGN